MMLGTVQDLTQSCVTSVGTLDWIDPVDPHTCVDLDRKWYSQPPFFFFLTFPCSFVPHQDDPKLI